MHSLLACSLFSQEQLPAASAIVPADSEDGERKWRGKERREGSRGGGEGENRMELTEGEASDVKIHS